jgi:hypothetical protein
MSYMPVDKPKSDVLILQLSRHHSVDLVRLPPSWRFDE